MQLHIERDSGVPLHSQIELQIRSRIDSGDLRVGDRLPASRRLARALGVNRATVTAAFDALAAAGLVEATVGRGTEIVRTTARAGSDLCVVGNGFCGDVAGASDSAGQSIGIARTRRSGFFDRNQMGTVPQTAG